MRVLCGRQKIALGKMHSACRVRRTTLQNGDLSLTGVLENVRHLVRSFRTVTERKV